MVGPAAGVAASFSRSSISAFLAFLLEGRQARLGPLDCGMVWRQLLRQAAISDCSVMILWLSWFSISLRTCCGPLTVTWSSRREL